MHNPVAVWRRQLTKTLPGSGLTWASRLVCALAVLAADPTLDQAPVLLLHTPIGR